MKRGMPGCSAATSKAARLNGTTENGSRFTECPACGKPVPLATADLHLELSCGGNDTGGKAGAREHCKDARRKQHTSKQGDGGTTRWNDLPAPGKAMPPGRESHLPGHLLLREFVSEDEEEEILRRLEEDDGNPWRWQEGNGAHYGKSFGERIRYGRNAVEPEVFPMPAYLGNIIRRLPSAYPPLTDSFCPTECNALLYVRGSSWLRPHVDDRQLSTDVIMNLSLGGDAVMTYSKERGAPHEVRVELPRRSLQVQAGPSRFEYQHGIRSCDVLSEKRVSITFREAVAKDNKKKPDHSSSLPSLLCRCTHS